MNKKLIMPMMLALLTLGSCGEAKECAYKDDPQGLAFHLLNNGTYGVTIGTAERLCEVNVPARHNGRPVTIVMSEFSNSNTDVCLRSLILPNTIELIEARAFENCWSLASIYIAGDINYLDANSFWSSSDNVEVYFEIDGPKANWNEDWMDGIAECHYGASIDEYHRARLFSDEYVHINSYGETQLLVCEKTDDGDISLAYIHNYPTHLEIPDQILGIKVKEVSDSFFDGGDEQDGSSLVKSLSIGRYVEKLSGHSFTFMHQLESISVHPKNVTYNSKKRCNAIIETKTKTLVYGCANTIIPKGVTTIGAYAFNEAHAIDSISVPEGVVAIEDEAFWGCNYLKTVSLPDSLTSIGNRVFSYCYVIEKLFIPKGVTTVGSAIFDNWDGESLKIYAEATEQPEGWAGDWLDGIYWPSADAIQIHWGATRADAQ